MTAKNDALKAAEPDLIILKVRNLVVRFGKVTILGNVTLDIREGEVFGIVGMSGSGKTTLLNTIMGVLQPVSGSVYYKPQRIIRTKEDTTQFKIVRGGSEDIKHTFGFSAQTPSFYPKLTVKENLEYFGTMYGLPKEVKETNIEILLDLVGLTPSINKIAEKLSGGMQKRLDIACALIHNPHVLILDEPTSDLDPILRGQMWNLVRRINQRGTTVILSSHFLEELETLCSRIAILYDAQVAAVGTPEELQVRFHLGEIVVVKTRAGNYERVISELKRSYKFADKHFLERNDKLEIRVPDASVLIEELKDEMDVEAAASAMELVPSLSAQDVLKRVIRILDQDKEDVLFVSAARTDLGSIFEGIVLEGKEGKK